MTAADAQRHNQFKQGRCHQWQESCRIKTEPRRKTACPDTFGQQNLSTKVDEGLNAWQGALQGSLTACEASPAGSVCSRFDVSLGHGNHSDIPTNALITRAIYPISERARSHFFSECQQQQLDASKICNACASCMTQVAPSAAGLTWVRSKTVLRRVCAAHNRQTRLERAPVHCAFGHPH
ncbi:hypothetical protein M2244_001304 [Rhodoferax antarcticus]|nr:hypothetical protein [Rhodoferax antarcticus]